MPESLISARGLTKKYGDFTAVDAIDFDVAKGESFGLLGPNGAGKSTTMRIIAATSQRTSGTISILGRDPEEHGPQIRAHLGVVPQQDNLDGELTVTENLFIYGRYFGLSKKFIRAKVEELLAFAQLEEKRDVKVDALSGGMKRRLTIARALVSEPDILMLDEPTTGLDPQARHILWDRLFRELPDRILMYVEDGEALLETILSKKLHPTTSLVRRSSLEDVFLRLTGRSLIE